jgi:hypothetical protein
MVNLPKHEISSHSVGHPGKEVRQPPIAGGGVQPKPGNALHGKGDERKEVNKTGHAVVTNGMYGNSFGHEDVGLNNSPHIAEELLVGWNEILPAGIFVSYKSPVNAEQKIEKENVRSHKMDEPYSTHNEQV